MNRGLRVRELAVHTLSGIHFDVAPGQCVGLSGPSGSGKSLMLRALADIDPHDGDVWLDGILARDIPAPIWRKRVGLLPAETAWWHDTVGPHFSAMPDDLLTELGFDADVMDWHISRLSSGERQRLGLLRMMANQPDVLLLDEPTANLDQMSIVRVENVLARHRRQNAPAMVWVGHDPDQLQRNCDPIYTIENRHLVEQAGTGSPVQ